MSSKMQFQVFYGDNNVLYGLNGVDFSAFKCTSSAIDKSLERSFGSIYKWLQYGFCVDPETHVMIVHFCRLSRSGLPCSDDWLTKMQPWVEQWEQADEHLVHPTGPTHRQLLKGLPHLVLTPDSGSSGLC